MTRALIIVILGTERKDRSFSVDTEVKDTRVWGSTATFTLNRIGFHLKFVIETSK